MARSTFITSFLDTQRVIRECIETLPPRHQKRLLRSLDTSNGLLTRAVDNRHGKFAESLSLLHQRLRERGISRLADMPLEEPKIAAR